MKRYNIAIIGAGNVSAFYDNPQSKNMSTHAHAIVLDNRVMLSGFYDIDKNKAIKATEIWGGKAFNTIEDAVKASDIVFICVPDRCHGEVLYEVMKYNPVAIVTEKPLTSSLNEAYKIKKKSMEKEIPIFLNYTRRYVPEFHELHDLIKKGDFGCFRRGICYYGKGVLHNGGHIIDLLSFLLSDDIRVKSVSEAIIDFDEDDPTLNVSLTIGDGSCDLVGVDCRNVTIFELDLLFENARLRILDNGTVIEHYTVNESKDFAGYRNYYLEKTIKTSWMPVVPGLLNNVINNIENNETIWCGVDEGIKVLEINELIKRKKNT